MTGTDEQGENGVLVPFIVCQQAGGSYPDEPFTAGFECGQVFAELRQCEALGAIPATRWMRPEVAAQTDLFAMALGYTTTVIEHDEQGRKRVAFARPCQDGVRVAGV